MKILTTIFISSCCLAQIIICRVSTAHVSSAGDSEYSSPNTAVKQNDYGYDDDDDDDDEDDDKHEHKHKHSRYCTSLPQYTPHYCLQSRLDKLKVNTKTYRLSIPPKIESVDPTMLTQVKVFGFFLFPLLDLSNQEVLMLSAQDPKEKRLSELYVYMVRKNQELVRENSMKEKVFKTFCDYANLLDYFREKQQIPGSPNNKFFKFPSKEEHFKDIITTGDWQDDKVFVEQRLAGMNPMSLRKLNAEEFNSSVGRFSPDLDRAIRRVLNNEETSLLQVIEEGSIFIADFPLIHNLSNIPDVLDLNPNDNREMRVSKSPVAVFASVKNCYSGTYELTPVAIQMDFNADSDVVLPTDGSRWQLAKQEVQRADLTHLEIVEHLLKTHLMMEPICVTIKRTLSIYHPLNAILQWHCRGTFVTNSIGLPNLVNQYGYMHKLLAIGDVGSIELLNRGYLALTWDDTNFEENLKKRGVNDHEKLPYYPYRDDGAVIWDVIKEFAKDYVKMYYYYTQDILYDHELQNFANELSADGVGSTGGMGMVKKFPAEIQSREQLADILARIIFIPIQHHVVAYPVEYYGGFVPNMPAKLYDDPRVPAGESGVYSLPESHVASYQVGLAMSLGSLRYDRLFDYYRRLSDRNVRHLVHSYHYHLMGAVRGKIRRRNWLRLKNGHLTYPYFLPNWIPNSIHA